MALLTPAASGQAAALSESAEATDETCDFAALGATAGIEFRIKRDAHHYRTTGTGTVICRETGKEYDLCERLVERNSGRDILIAAIDFGPAQIFIPGSERDQVVPPANPDGKIIPITNVMTRREFFEALRSFQDGRPADPYRPYMDFCYEHGLFEIFTKEYIEALAAYLDGRIKQLAVRLKRPVKILEIGAGDGKLTHFLTEELRKRGVDTFRMFATDGGNPGEDMHLQPLYPVIDERHDEALWDFEPDIVVCSWMMRNMDLTREIRQTPTVDEYILIGPTDIGTCGQLWET